LKNIFHLDRKYRQISCDRWMTHKFIKIYIEVVYIYNFKKMLASVIAVGTMATSIASLPAEAGSLSARPDSAFTYDLAVEGTTDGQIKVTFYTTYNPGVSVLGVALKYDTDKLNFAKE